MRHNFQAIAKGLGSRIGWYYCAAKLAIAESSAVDDRWRIKSGALHLPPSPSPGSWSSESSPFPTVFGLRFDCACTLPLPVFNFRRYTRATKINQRENKDKNFLIYGTSY